MKITIRNIKTKRIVKQGTFRNRGVSVKIQEAGLVINDILDARYEEWPELDLIKHYITINR